MFSDGESIFSTQSKFKDGSEFVYIGDVLSDILNKDGENAINPNFNLKCDVLYWTEHVHVHVFFRGKKYFLLQSKFREALQPRAVLKIIY